MSSALADQAGSRANLPGRAVAALESIMIDKGPLQWMQRAVFGETLDRCDVRAVLHDREGQARIDPAIVDQNRAGAALAVVAALLRSGQPEMNPQCVEKRRPRRERQLFRYAIDMKRDGHFRRRRQIFSLFGSR